MERAKAIGTNIRIAREKLGLSQEELAERIGYEARNAIGRFERGEQMPRLEVLFDLGDALGITVVDLLEGTYSRHTRAKPALMVAEGEGTYTTNTKKQRAQELLQELAELIPDDE